MSISAGVSKRNGFIFTVGQEIPRLLWNPKAHYPVHKRPPLVPILSLINSFHIFASCLLNIHLILSSHLRGCIQKLPDWPPGARTANGKALRHWAQLYRYFVSRSSEFCHHNSLCCFSTSLYCCCLLRYQLSPETFGYTLVRLVLRDRYFPSMFSH
jgi:hypothetical protein